MNEKKYYAMSDEDFDELLRLEEEDKKDILKLPVYYTEDGKKRYIDVAGIGYEGDINRYFIYDEKLRLIEAYEYGDLTKYYFNDRKKKVTIVFHDAEYGGRHKNTYDVFTDEETQKYGVWCGNRKEREREFREKLRKKP